MGAVDFCPVDSDLRDGDAEPLGNVQQLHIKAPPLQVQALKQPPRAVPREQLEPALCVWVCM